MTNAPKPTVPSSFVDAGAMKTILAKAARSYGQVLGGAGLVDAVMASSWAWAGRGVAIAITVLGAVGIIAGLLFWGKNNVSTLRELTGVSRTFWAGSVLAWGIGAILAIVLKNATLWWVLALVLVAIGGYCAWQAMNRAKEIENRATPSGALH